MGEHFWPSMYPGLIVGLMYGLYAGGWMRIIIATVGGLLGALGYALAFPALVQQDGLLPLLGLLLSALVVAFCLVAISQRMTKPS